LSVCGKRESFERGIGGNGVERERESEET